MPVGRGFGAELTRPDARNRDALLPTRRSLAGQPSAGKSPCRPTVANGGHFEPSPLGKPGGFLLGQNALSAWSDPCGRKLARSWRSPPENELPGRPVEPIVHAHAHHFAGEFGRCLDGCTLNFGIDRIERQGTYVVMQKFDLAGPGSHPVFEAAAEGPAPQRLAAGSDGSDTRTEGGETRLGAAVGEAARRINQ